MLEQTSSSYAVFVFVCVQWLSGVLVVSLFLVVLGGGVLVGVVQFSSAEFRLVVLTL
jgi:hypothetical protein